MNEFDGLDDLDALLRTPMPDLRDKGFANRTLQRIAAQESLRAKVLGGAWVLGIVVCVLALLVSGGGSSQPWGASLLQGLGNWHWDYALATLGLGVVSLLFIRVFSEG